MSQPLLFPELTPTREQPERPVVRSASPRAVQFLLPVWGERYIEQFLQFCLPTLLAPGNIPAVAKTLPSTFIFLTNTEGAALLRSHPGCRYLDMYCTVEIVVIDDLITEGNHSTTITLAYERAVRALGNDMVNTCFFFLISDYVMANGSLANVLNRILAGASGVLAGNFQVVEEEAVKTFVARFDRGQAELALPPRDLMDWALGHLHPMTAANTVNFSLSRSSHSNRLFWRVDENTLIGRFYLMHMICIRPEITDFSIGSSCDYSFIPEMCPSGKVEVMTDSDDYLVIEMQPRNHERNLLRLGKIAPSDLALSLAEWTTARHRQNSQNQIVFHARDLPEQLSETSREAEAFMAKVTRHLKTKPQPHRDHPYWIGAIVAHRWAIRRKQGLPADADDILWEHNFHLWLMERLRNFMFGRIPKLHPWHPLWPDFRAASIAVRRSIAEAPGRLLLVTPRPLSFADWFADVAPESTAIQPSQLIRLDAKEYARLVNSFDTCFLFLDEDFLDQSAKVIERVRPLLTRGGNLVILTLTGRGTSGPAFCGLMTDKAGTFVDRTMALKETRYVVTGRLRINTTEALVRLRDGVFRSPQFYYPMALMLGPFHLLKMLMVNLFSMRTRLDIPRRGTCSSILLIMKSETATKEMPKFDEPHLNSTPERFRMRSSRIVEHLWNARRS